MQISKDQRSYMKKFARTDEAKYACENLKLNYFEFSKAVVSTDPLLFFKFYEPLVTNNYIKDRNFKSTKQLQALSESMRKIKNTITEAVVKSDASKPINKPKKPVAKLQNKSIELRESNDIKAAKVRYNFMIDKDTLAQLEAYASETERSASSVIRLAIKDFLQKDSRK